MNSARWNRRRLNPGFTFVELVIVLVIVAVATAVAAPRYTSALASFRVRASANRVAADLSMARRQARLRSVSTVVAFNLDDQSYTVSGAPDPDRPATSLQVRAESEEFPSTLSTADFGGSPVVTFNFYGRPSSAGSVQLTSGGESRLVSVNAYGRVTVE